MNVLLFYLAASLNFGYYILIYGFIDATFNLLYASLSLNCWLNENFSFVFTRISLVDLAATVILLTLFFLFQILRDGFPVPLYLEGLLCLHVPLHEVL